MNVSLKHHDIEQNTDEWLAMRAGKFTSSNAGKVMANYPKAFGEPAKKYAIQLAVEQITGKPSSSGFSNEHTERGHAQEPLARMLYEEETFCDVSKGGFFCNEIIGCSPDGLVYDDGLIEIKSVISSVHFANIKRSFIDPAYKWQCVANLKLTDRKWLDFVSYCQDFPDGRKIYTYRMHAEKYDGEFFRLKERLSDFMELVEQAKDKILTSEYFILED